MKFLRRHALDLLLVFAPIAVITTWLHADAMWSFIASALALIPLAGRMGEATETIARRVGAGLGGLMNATFGNAAELILAIAGVRAGQDVLVKASLSGSIIGNLLLVLGGAAFVGGLQRDKQTFPATAASASASMLLVSVAALLGPAVLHLTPDLPPNDGTTLSVATSVVLLISYGGGLIFSLRTHAHLYAQEDDEEHEARSIARAVVMLIGVTAVVAVMAEILVATVEHAVEQIGLTRTFVGVVVVAVVGNAAEHSTAILMAMKNRMDIAVAICLESSKQVALFVVPVIVLLSYPLRGRWLTLDFPPSQILALFSSAIILNFTTQDGETNWLEGLQLLALYAVLAIMFFFVP